MSGGDNQGYSWLWSDFTGAPLWWPWAVVISSVMALSFPFFFLVAACCGLGLCVAVSLAPSSWRCWVRWHGDMEFLTCLHQQEGLKSCTGLEVPSLFPGLQPWPARWHLLLFSYILKCQLLLDYWTPHFTCYDLHERIITPAKFTTTGWHSLGQWGAASPVVMKT